MPCTYVSFDRNYESVARCLACILRRTTWLSEGMFARPLVSSGNSYFAYPHHVAPRILKKVHGRLIGRPPAERPPVLGLTYP